MNIKAYRFFFYYLFVHPIEWKNKEGGTHMKNHICEKKYIVFLVKLIRQPLWILEMGRIDFGR